MKVTEKMRAVSLDVTLSVLIVLVGAALPWGRSGRADRSSFELVQVARRLEVLDGGAAAAAKLWLAVPLVVAVIVIAGAAGRRRIALAAGTAVALAAVGLAVATYRSPLIPRYGLPITMVGAGLLVVIGAGGTVRRFHRRPTDRARGAPTSP